MKGHYRRITNKKLQKAIRKSPWRGNQKGFLFGVPKKPKDIVDYENFMCERLK